jgi:hypothetical protein
MFYNYFLSVMTLASLILGNAESTVINNQSVFNGAMPAHKNVYTHTADVTTTATTTKSATPTEEEILADLTAIEYKELTKPDYMEYIPENYNYGDVVPAQLTSYSWDGGGADGTRWTQGMLECAAVDKCLCGGTVQFYNTGYSSLDGLTFEIHDTGGAVDYRRDEYSETGKSYVFDILQTEALRYVLGDDWGRFINQGRIKGCKAVVHKPDGCTYVFDFDKNEVTTIEESNNDESIITTIEEFSNEEFITEETEPVEEFNNENMLGDSEEQVFYDEYFE